MISVIIPAYKNTEMLAKNLRNNLAFLEGNEVIIINDDPSRSIKEDLKDYPVILVENSKNLGFSGSVNAGFNKASHAYVLLLNTDVILTDDSWKEAVRKLQEDGQLFAVSFAQKESGDRTVGKNRIFWEKGFLLHEKAQTLSEGPNAWAEGGSCMIRKSFFDTLNGFDEIFAPFYWEDIDLSFRAWKAGYTVIFDPHIVVQHHHESTIGKYFDRKRIDKISYRNQFIFIWKNISGSFLYQHLVRLPLFLLVILVNPPALTGFFSALLQVPAIIQKRKLQKNLYKLSDMEVLDIFNTS